VSVDQPSTTQYLHEMSVVIPVFQGEATLPGLIDELVPYTTEFSTPMGFRAVIREVVLVWDHGSRDSATVMRVLRQKYSWIRTVWLSRNFGQHSATLAGISSTVGAWIVTMDEDGLHNPAFIPNMLDRAIQENAQLVYSKPLNAAPHGFLRNIASRTTKWIFGRFLNSSSRFDFSSYRLLLGEIGRSTAAYCGPDVYLDVAFGWVTQSITYCDVELRSEGRASSYSYKRLLSHFWRMVISSGTRPLRLVTVMGLGSSFVGILMALYFAYRRVINDIAIAGWTSTMVLLLLIGGIIIGSLGVIAEYVGVSVKMAMGKPNYLITQDPQNNPLEIDEATEQ
jgi:polyisoprenyl-phosphate glycosyltransferase